MTELNCFKAYDIRGQIGVDISEDIVYRISRAVAKHLKAKSVIIGFDALETSPAYANAARAELWMRGPMCLIWVWLVRRKCIGQ